MSPLIDAWVRFFTAPSVPAAAFHVARGYLGGLRRPGKTGSAKSSVFRTLTAGMIDPSFEKRNIARPELFRSVLKDAASRLGSPDGPIALLLPETCVKTALLTFDDLPAAPAECERIVRWRLAKNLPLRPAETRLSFDVRRSKGRAVAFCVLALEAVVQEYERAFDQAGLKVRMIGLPTVQLLGCLPRNGESNFLVVNVEEDHIAALAVLEGETALFRVKPLTAGDVWAEAADEVATTLRFLEDREKKRIDAVWVRPAAAGAAEDGLALLQKRTACPVRMIADEAMTGIPPAEKIFLASLWGQMS
jgi:hypothetical protein